MKILTPEIAFKGQPSWVKSAAVDEDGAAYLYGQPSKDLCVNASEFDCPSSEKSEMLYKFSTEDWKKSAIDRDFNEFPAPDNENIVKTDGNENVVKDLPTFESGLFEQHPEVNYWRVNECGFVSGHMRKPKIVADETGKFWYEFSKTIELGEEYNATNWETWKLDRSDYEEWLSNNDNDLPDVEEMEDTADYAGVVEDLVNNPSHYTQGEVECIDAIKSALTEEEYRGYCKGNVLKYIWREKHKGGQESIDKAQWYLNKVGEI